MDWDAIFRKSSVGGLGLTCLGCIGQYRAVGFRFNRIYRVLGLLGLAKSRDKAFTFNKGDLIIKLPSWAALCSIYIYGWLSKLGSLFGSRLGYSKRDHNFDNYPYMVTRSAGPPPPSMVYGPGCPPPLMWDGVWVPSSPCGVVVGVLGFWV